MRLIREGGGGSKGDGDGDGYCELEGSPMMMLGGR